MMGLADRVFVLRLQVNCTPWSTISLAGTVFNLGLQQRGPTGPIQPKIGGHLEKEGALT